jgi:ATP-dependent Lhr-like helicase
MLHRVWSYRHLSRERFDAIFRFVEDGGYVLSAYTRFKRLLKGIDGLYRASSRVVVQRHRQNIGVINEAAKLKVRKMHKRGGRVLGEVEESFAQQLTPGDTFFFAGEILEFVAVRDMYLEARSSAARAPKVPAYAGASMPLSTFLGGSLRRLLDDPASDIRLPPQIDEWLELQKRFSALPGPDRLVIESFPRGRLHYLVLYTFEGRKANQTLGMLVTRRMERAKLRPLSFTVTDYGLAISSISAVAERDMATLIGPDILADELEEWIVESPMLKRSFRHVAMVSGLTEQNHARSRKSLKQVTFSTDLIYDTLLRHEPDHILISMARADAERELLDIPRLTDLLMNFRDKHVFKLLTRPSPFAIPILLDVRTERVHGGAIEMLLAQPAQEESGESMMRDVRADCL